MDTKLENIELIGRVSLKCHIQIGRDCSEVGGCPIWDDSIGKEENFQYFILSAIKNGHRISTNALFKTDPTSSYTKCTLHTPQCTLPLHPVNPTHCVKCTVHTVYRLRLLKANPKWSQPASMCPTGVEGMSTWDKLGIL